MKLSSTLQKMLSPLVVAIGSVPVSLLAAVKRTGKRGNKAHYPTDLRRIRVVLEAIHDVTGRAFEVAIEDGNMELGIARLRALWAEEDYLCRMESAFYAR